MESTVKDLIKKLTALENQDRKVMLVGCDCANEWNGTIKEPEYSTDRIYLNI